MAYLKTKQEQEQERIANQQKRTGNYTLNTNKLALLYSRYSTSKANARGIAEGLEQSEKMIALATDYEWARALMVLFLENNVADSGKIKSISGTLPIEKRAKLSTIVEYITSDQASGLFCDDISRLTRDADLVDASVLGKACREHNVPIITSNRVFDFRRDGDYEAYIGEAQAAASWRKTHLFGKMLANRTRKAERGKIANRVAPIGLMLDDTRDNLMPSPHHDRVNWLYRRFRAHSASLAGLMHEVKEMELRGEPVFPVDSRIDPRTIYAEPMYRNAELIGWTIRSRSSMRHLLCNPAYLGIVVFNHRIMKEAAFPAIVDRELWEYANSYLGKTELDGTPLERTKREVRYEQYGHNNTALLAGCRDSGKLVIDGTNGQHVYVQPAASMGGGRTVYVLKDLSASVNGYITSIASAKLDAYIEARILHWLQTSQRAMDRGHKPDRSPAVAANAVQNTTPAVAPKTIHQALAETREELVKVNRRLAVAGDVMSDGELRDTYASQARLEQREHEQVKAIAQLERLALQTEQGKRDIVRAHAMYRHWKLEKKRQFIRLVTSAIYLEKQADGDLQLTLVYSPIMGLADNGLWAVDTAVISRVPDSVKWTHDNQSQVSEYVAIFVPKPWS